MIVERLELVDFRNYTAACFDLAEGVTAVLGANGQGKTNFAEALGYLATLSSFRGVTNDVLVRAGGGPAILRAQIRDEQGRTSLIEAEISAQGRTRVQVNRQRLQRARDLLGTMRVSVFSPDDLVMVKGGPAERRGFMDDVLVALAVKYDAARRDLDRVVTQRNRLLKQVGGRLGAEEEVTLEVWDAQFAVLGDRFARARAEMIRRLQPLVGAAYGELAGVGVDLVRMEYTPCWGDGGLLEALAAARTEDLRRQVTTLGPHRDDLGLWIDGLPARTHASQGEQRSLALALRLGAHRLIAEHVGSTPVLVLDDVLSELDTDRATSLVRSVTEGQVIITSAVALPSAAVPDRILHIRAGGLEGSTPAAPGGSDER